MTDALPYLTFLIGLVFGVVGGAWMSDAISLDQIRRTGSAFMGSRIRIVGHIEHEIRKDKWVREDME